MSESPSTTSVDGRGRFRGALFGLATGDALGTTLEFRPPGSFDPIADMVGGGPFDLEPGQWTDDTSMALCLAESLVERRRFDPLDQLDRYLRWYDEGHLSSTGECFDIGNTTRDALVRYRRAKRSGRPPASYYGSTYPQTAGNGSIMRLAPVPMAFLSAPLETAVECCGESSRTTHGAREAVDACRYLGALLIGALKGEDRDTLLGGGYAPDAELWRTRPLAPAIAEIAAGSFRSRQPPEIRGTGYVVKSLEAALWAFHGTDDFRAGALTAVNLGDDADTTGAVYGQLAGAFYGYDAIPRKWRERLALKDTIAELADGLWALQGINAGAG